MLDIRSWFCVHECKMTSTVSEMMIEFRKSEERQYKDKNFGNENFNHL